MRVLPTLLTLAVVAWPGAAWAQPSRIDTLVARASAYVDDFVLRFANVVAEERYEQVTTAPRRRRQLVSDFLLVKPEGANEVFQFRDVREVDGEPVRGRDERLTRLFLEPSDTAIEHARRISREGARYNLANIGTANLPLTGVGLLQTRYRDGLRFRLGRREEDLGPDVWLVNYEELQTSRILGPQSWGRVWIEEGTGRIVRMELRLGRARFPAQITTSFAYDEELQLNVPVEMRDWYPSTRFGDLTGTATYGRFRRFQVSTDEEFR